jgi:hypothetical protein
MGEGSVHQEDSRQRLDIPTLLPRRQAIVDKEPDTLTTQPRGVLTGQIPVGVSRLHLMNHARLDLGGIRT